MRKNPERKFSVKPEGAGAVPGAPGIPLPLATPGDSFNIIINVFLLKL